MTPQEINTSILEIDSTLIDKRAALLEADDAELSNQIAELEEDREALQAKLNEFTVIEAEKAARLTTLTSRMENGTATVSEMQEVLAAYLKDKTAV